MRSFDVILACTKAGGIGLKNALGWKCSDELKLFKTKTMGSTVIMGRRTAERIPSLPGRTIISVGKTPTAHRTAETIQQALEIAEPDRPIFVAGGGEIYRTIFGTDLINRVNRLHVSIMTTDYPCDIFVPINWRQWVIVEQFGHPEFIHRVCRYDSSNENSYLNLLDEVLSSGAERKGRNGLTRSVFFRTLSFDLRQGFPLLTTKKMFLRGVIEELLFFLHGQTDATILKKKGVNIWNGNTDRAFLDQLGMTTRPEGVMGPLYGYQWRHYNAPYSEKDAAPLQPGLDQLANLINSIRTDPTSRRLLLTDFNPLQVDQGVLYPCHSIIIQFYVQDGRLDMSCYNRSQDLFLGVPFNIASSALFLTLIAKVTNLIPGVLHMCLGDVHIYEPHFDAVKEQLSRVPYSFPQLAVPNVQSLAEIEQLAVSDFVLTNYSCYDSIKADMVP